MSNGKQFLDDPSMEVTEERLEEILDEEFSKPEGQMDYQLVDEILDELNPRKVDSEEIEESWKRLEKKMDAFYPSSAQSRPEGKTAKKGGVRFLRIAAIAAAVIVILLSGSIGVAKATRWTFLMEFLSPLTETFGISLGVQNQEEKTKEAYKIASDDSEVQQFNSVDEIPLKYDGYRIRLDSIPERLTLTDGQFYPSGEMNVFNFQYQAGNEWLSYNVNVFENEDVNVISDYETTLEVVDRRYIGMIEVLFYRNDDLDTRYVSWVDRNAHYSLYGNLPMDELYTIIEGIE